MSRSVFKWWGAELDNGRFACALAALGVLGAQQDVKGKKSEQLQDTDAILDNIRKQNQLDPLAPLRWSPNISLTSLSGKQNVPSASQLADAWDRLKTNATFPMHIELDPPESYRSILPWIYRQLTRYEVNIQGLYVLLPGTYKMPDWNWPLRLGFLNLPSTGSFFDQLGDGWYHSNLIELIKLSPETPSCDILVMPCSPRDTLKRLLDLKFEPRASCVMLLGQSGVPWVHLNPLLDAIRTELRASGVCLAPIPESDQADWLKRIINELSHNRTLDMALMQTLIGDDYPLFFASRDLLTESRLESRVMAMAMRMVAMPEDAPPLNISSRTAEILSMPVGEHSPQEVGKLLQTNVEAGNYRYYRESNEASGISELSREERKANTATPEQLRFIQAKVFDVGQGEPRLVKDAFVGDVQYGAKVRIGPADLEWLTPETEGVFPEHLLPPGDLYMLQVFFSEPNHVPEVQNATIKLPRRGTSTECNFLFRVNKEIPVFEGRIIVSHKNRILQTALLKGAVVENLSQINGINEIKIETEVVVRPTMAGLSGRPKFDLSLLVNHGSDSCPRLTRLAEDHASIRNIDGLQDSITNIQSRLESVAQSMENTDNSNTGGLLDDRTEGLLRYLAIHGRMLYDAIITDQMDDGWLPQNLERIQLISASAESYLPLEFLYEKSIPQTDARLCPSASAALKEGKCQNCLIKDDSEESLYICPIGFWCLSKVIERHTHDNSFKKMVGASDYVMQAEPIDNRIPLNVLRSCLFAASDRVDKVVPGQRQQFLQTLNTVSGNAGVMVSSWEDWAHEVYTKHPTLLVLMPHTFEDENDDLPALEIGASDHLTSGQIISKFIRASPEDQAPIVALLGCHTMVPYNMYKTFVPPFRRHGAALVLSTLTTVMGRQIVPIAQKLIEEMKEQLERGEGRTVTFGDVLLNVRRKLLLQGLPIVLCLVAFGDADWRLTSGGGHVPH